MHCVPYCAVHIRRGDRNDRCAVPPAGRGSTAQPQAASTGEGETTRDPRAPATEWSWPH